jgi:hypothetical protein
MKEALANLYLEWVNEFLTIGGFADFYHIEDTDAEVLIRLGRRFHEERVEAILPKPPPGYTAEELERDNPYNAWMQDHEV